MAGFLEYGPEGSIVRNPIPREAGPWDAYNTFGEGSPSGSSGWGQGPLGSGRIAEPEGLGSMEDLIRRIRSGNTGMPPEPYSDDFLRRLSSHGRLFRERSGVPALWEGSPSSQAVEAEFSMVPRETGGWRGDLPDVPERGPRGWRGGSIPGEAPQELRGLPRWGGEGREGGPRVGAPEGPGIPQGPSIERGPWAEGGKLGPEGAPKSGYMRGFLDKIAKMPGGSRLIEGLEPVVKGLDFLGKHATPIGWGLTAASGAYGGYEGYKRGESVSSIAGDVLEGMDPSSIANIVGLPGVTQAFRGTGPAKGTLASDAPSDAEKSYFIKGIQDKIGRGVEDPVAVAKAALQYANQEHKKGFSYDKVIQSANEFLKQNYPHIQSHAQLGSVYARAYAELAGMNHNAVNTPKEFSGWAGHPDPSMVDAEAFSRSPGLPFWALNH